MTQTLAGVWWNYEFTTDLPCPNGCPVPHPLYIGKSSRPDLRYVQHANAPWRPYASGFFVYPDPYPTEADSLAAEEYRIRTRLPYANKEHNENNPCRLDFGPAVLRPRRPVVRPRRARRRWLRPARRLAWGVVVWLVLAVVVFVVLPNSTPFGTAVESSVTGASLCMVAGWWARRPRRRRRRHRRG